jgi:hypothetical protein
MWVAGLPACLLACLPRPGGPAGISLLPAQLPARLLTCLADPKPTEGVQSNLKRIKTGEQWDGTQRCCRLPPCLPACLPACRSLLLPPGVAASRTQHGAASCRRCFTPPPLLPSPPPPRCSHPQLLLRLDVSCISA